MARSPRLLRHWRGREVYHVYQRGNRRQKTFPSAAAYFSYLQRFFLLVKRYNVHVHAFCLMPNHVHFILEPNNKRGLSDFMRDLQSGHARWLHSTLNTNGHAWKHHFGCIRLTSAHYRTALWYVENNPVRAELASRAHLWPYSSAVAHVRNAPVTLHRKGRSITIVLAVKRWREEFGHLDWSAWLADPIEEELRVRLAEVEQVLGSDHLLLGSKAAMVRPTPKRQPGTVILAVSAPPTAAAGRSPMSSPPRRC